MGEDAASKVVKVNGPSQKFCADLLKDVAGALGRKRLARLRREQRNLHATRATYLWLRAVNDEANVMCAVNVRGVAQAIENR